MKNLGDPEVYVEALVRASFTEADDTASLVIWLLDEDHSTTVRETPLWRWWMRYADSLRKLAPKPQSGFRAINSRKGVGFPKIGRNDPCPCGSGKKFKQCHLGLEEESSWNLKTSTPRIYAMAVAQIVRRLSPEQLESVPLEKVSPVALAEMAAVHHDAGHLEKAIQQLHHLLVSERKDPHLLYDYLIARYAEWLVEADRFEEAERFLLDEYKKPRAVQSWQISQKIAAFYLDQKNLDSAERWIEVTLKESEENPFNHYLKGLLHHMRDQWDEAVSAYTEAEYLGQDVPDKTGEPLLELIREATLLAREKKAVTGEAS